MSPRVSARPAPSPPLFSAPLRRPPRSPLFPYTTLFRSRARASPPTPSARSRSRRTPTTTSRSPSSGGVRSEEHTSEIQSLRHLVCRLLLEKKKNNNATTRCELRSSENVHAQYAQSQHDA